MIGSAMGYSQELQTPHLVYTIHASVGCGNLRLVYAFLPDEKEESFRKLLSLVPETSAKQITIVSELAVQRAFLKWNEHIQIQFCFFHLGQNVEQHVQSFSGLLLEFC